MPAAPKSPDGSRRSPRAPGVDPARDAAFRRLARQANKYPDCEPGGPKTDDLSPRDAAFAHAIYDAAMRRLLTISGLLAPFLRSPFEQLDARVKGVLLAGGAQLFFLDRVPPHAVLNESVEWAKVAIRPETAGLVNAVLRRLAELRESATLEDRPWLGSRAELPRSDGRVLAFPREILFGDEARVLARATSHPEALVRRWTTRLGAESARALALHSLVEAPAILNITYAGSPVEHPALELSPHETPGFVVVGGEHAALGEVLRTRRDVWAQDPASARVIEGVRDLSPRVIIDACAGRGTKTRQLAAVFPNARILATDADEPRVRALREATAHLPNVEVIAFDALSAHAGQADLVLLDVPCSNTGVLARRVEAKYRAPSEAGVSDLVPLQRRIVQGALPLLVLEGSILYSTCSVEPEENEDQARAIAALGFRLEREHRLMPQGLPGEPATRYRDGSYSALLRQG